MKKIININLSGRVVPIEDAAYESLQRYIESLRRHFAHEDGRDEIINDIESRIAELMSDKIKRGAAAITEADMDEIIGSMGRIEDFEEVDMADTTSQSSYKNEGEYTQAQGKAKTKGRLYRDASDKLLGGVCSGISNYMNVDPAIVRLLFAIITFGGFGAGILIYVLLWIILPVRDLDSYTGKRLFRNPEDKVISGVAGGLGAYFDKPSWIIRLIFAGPLLLNILFGTLHGVFFNFHRDIFPNVFIGSFTGTFILAYIILWIVLPEARSPFEKMEMRGEKVDVNRIRQNVQAEMENIKSRAQSWGEEVKASAQELGAKARDFAGTRSRSFASEVSQTARPAARGVLRVIGVLIKAFFLFVAGAITLSLFTVLMIIIFGGAPWWPINGFLWTSRYQQLLAWGTLLLFLGVPIIGFMTWLIRRVIRVRSKSAYLSWTFGGLWLVGWVCAILFAASIARDLSVYDKAEAVEVPMTQPSNGKLIVQVNEPEIRYNGGIWWVHDDDGGWDITDDTLKYNHVKVRIDKSDDSLYHVRLYKYSAGSNRSDAQKRAAQIGFNASVQDSILNIGSGISITRASKFRAQGLIMEVQVPVGKKIRFDPSLDDAYNSWVVRMAADYNRYRRHGFHADWDDDEYVDYERNVDYVMTSDGKLINPEKAEKNKKGIFEKKTNIDSLRRKIEERDKQNEQDKKKLEEMEQKSRDSSQTTTKIKQHYSSDAGMAYMLSPFAPLII